MERAGELIDQGVFEIPDVPQEGGFIKGPLGNARDMGGKVAHQRPGQHQRESKIETQDGEMTAQGRWVRWLHRQLTHCIPAIPGLLVCAALFYSCLRLASWLSARLCGDSVSQDEDDSGKGGVRL